jgi:multidrug efflux pump subunit AcrB
MAGKHGGGATGGAPRDLAMIRAVELAQRSGAQVRLGDVATIEDGIASRPDPGGGPVMLGIQVQPGADPDPVIAAIRAAAVEIAAALPPRCALAEAPAPAHDDRRRLAIAVAVRGPEWTTLEQLAGKLERDLRASRCLVSAVASDHRASSTVQVILPDLARAASLGISPTEISTTIRDMTIGPGKLQAGARDTPIVLRIGSQDLAVSAAIDRVQVRTARGELVPLSAVATVTTRPSVNLTRRNRERAITISVDPIAWPLRDVVRRKISELTRELPAGYHATVLPRP